MFKYIIFAMFTLGMLCSCGKQPAFDPNITYNISDKEIRMLPSPFKPLSSIEKDSSWGKEYIIGISFAKKLDLYRAITTFERALVLIPKQDKERILELHYNILLCYFLGKKYDDVIKTFEETPLGNASGSFPAFHDLIIILYKSYLEIGEPERAEKIIKLLQKQSPQLANNLLLSTALVNNNQKNIEAYVSESSHLQYIPKAMEEYQKHTLSIKKARALNCIPGMGYFYVGQKRSGITALLLNGLFIAAAYHFFDHGQTAAGIITATIEMGWFLGGIYGAGLAAQQHNEREYNKYTSKIMRERNLFPVLMLQYGF